MFVLGGLSVNEISAVQEFQKETGKTDIVLGSTEMYGSNDFISLLSHFNSSDVSPKNKVTL